MWKSHQWDIFLFFSQVTEEINGSSFRFPLALCFAFYNALHLKEQFTYGAQHNRIRWGQFVHKWMKEILKDWTQQEICLATKCTNIFFSLQQQAKRENQVFSLIEKCFSSQDTFNDSTSKVGGRRNYKMLADVKFSRIEPQQKLV